MTVGKLEKILSKIKNKRMQIVVDKESLWDGNGTFTICSIKDVNEDWVRLCDGDGYGVFTSKGQERGSWQLILKGGL